MTPRFPEEDWVLEHGLEDVSDLLGLTPARNPKKRKEDLVDYDKDWKEYLKRSRECGSDINSKELSLPK
jgi:hypothetical protein